MNAIAGEDVQARFKPQHHRLEVTYPLDVNSDNFDPASDARTDALRLTSRLVPPKTNYAVGMFRAEHGGQLHLTPLQATLQMRPELVHIDERDQQRKADAAAAAAADAPAVVVKPRPKSWHLPFVSRTRSD